MTYVIIVLSAVALCLGLLAVVQECSKARPNGLMVSALILLCASIGAVAGSLLEVVLP